MKKIKSTFSVIFSTALLGTSCAYMNNLFSNNFYQKLDNCACIGIGNIGKKFLDDDPKAAMIFAEELAKLDYMNKCLVSSINYGFDGERLMYYNKDYGIAYACLSITKKRKER